MSGMNCCRVTLALLLAFVGDSSLHANSAIPTIMNLHVHVHSKGADHLFRALEAISIRAGFTCSPTISDYERGHVRLGGKVQLSPTAMGCGISQYPRLIYGSTLSPSMVQIDVYYEWPSVNPSLVKQDVDGIIRDLKAAMMKDPLIG